MATVKLKRLKIDQYRNVRPGTELRFDDGVNLVLGQNGSGKTTLLNLISVIVSHDFSGLRDESFALEYELCSEQCTAQVQITNRALPTPEADGSVSDVRVAPGDHHADFQYRIRLSSRDLPDMEATGTPRDITVTIGGEPHPKRPPAPPFAPGFLIDALADASGHLSTFYQAIVTLHSGSVARFDESLDCFLAMTGRSPVISGIGSPSVTKLKLAGRLGDIQSRYTFFEFSPWGLAQTIITAYDSPAGELRLNLTGETSTSPTPADTLAFLRSAAQTMGMCAAAFKPEVRSVIEDKHHRKHYEIRGFSYTFTTPGNATIHHDRLSYGQKRLLAFYYYLAATRSYVIADELVNGLHHGWIKACMDAIGERQAFLTSQNPLLFDYVEFDSIEQVQARFITCKSDLVDGAEQLVWQNMPRADAARFYEAYTDEIEQVGEILITRGLW